MVTTLITSGPSQGYWEHTYEAMTVSDPHKTWEMLQPGRSNALAVHAYDRYVAKTYARLHDGPTRLCVRYRR